MHDPIDRLCGNCIHYIPDGATHGDCRRYPPDANTNQFPTVIPTIVCGEHYSTDELAADHAAFKQAREVTDFMAEHVHATLPDHRHGK